MMMNVRFTATKRQTVIIREPQTSADRPSAACLPRTDPIGSMAVGSTGVKYVALLDSPSCLCTATDYDLQSGRWWFGGPVT